ncbi:MAG: phospholipid carrier-dependent glycosyltransferase [Chloroflexota bacterium]|jgi:hypothetical protein
MSEVKDRRIPISRSQQTWIATGLLLLFFFLAIDSLVGDSPTMDEQNHIARGLALLRTGDPRLSLEHPPLVNLLSALPLLTMPELRLPTDHPSWDLPRGWYEFADQFMWQYNNEATRIVFLARIPVVFLLIALALVGYRFAQALWGGFAGIFAFGLLLFEPNLMAHGRYATTDLGGTLFTFLTTFLLWILWQSPTDWDWRRWLAVSVAMGLAFGSKLSSIGFVVIWGILALLPLYPCFHYHNNKRYIESAGKRLLQLFTAGVASLVMVWGIFAFQIGGNRFESLTLHNIFTWPLPMPTFWAGLEQIFILTQSGRMPSFMLGRFSDDGFLTYFPVAFLTKTPLVLIFLLIVAAFVLLWRGKTRRRALFLLLPAILLYILTIQSALNIGYRHVLPALPYLLVLISGLAAPEISSLLSGVNKPMKEKVPILALTFGLITVIGIALWIHPHYLSYFNRIAGGPANGYRVLIDSNVDWGQDLLRLKSWMETNEVSEINLGWFGSAEADYYGLAYRPLPGIGRDSFFQLWWDVPFNRTKPEPGVYAISATSLWEVPLRVEEKTVYEWFRARQPDDRVGYSILIYHVR